MIELLIYKFPKDLETRSIIIFDTLFAKQVKKKINVD